MAEARAVEALETEGWRVLARRVRTAAGEIDVVAAREGLVAFVEVKARPFFSEAAASVSAGQQARLIAAGEIWLAAHPNQGSAGVRFDVILVDAEGRLRRIKDAFRAEN
jgi:putative endonuclease